ncbi:MAG: sugar ABC transporter ATP-binding protein [Devosia sp.]
MMSTTTSTASASPGPLLEAAGISKTYGAVRALRNASLTLLPGEVHALMGANGAGKSTLVKILTGAIRPTSGTIKIRGVERQVTSPADARRAGLVSVYQEPSLIPDLDIASNLKLTHTPAEPFRHWVHELGVPDFDLGETAHNLPLAVQRVADLARALAIEPDVILLDEMTAALPANLAERVLSVVRKQTESGRSIIFISHRFMEISALCDRATVLRDGDTVGVVKIEPEVEEKIVELMLGERIVRKHGAAAAAGHAHSIGGKTRLSVRNLSVGNKLSDVSFDLHDGEIAGVVALEGQGQDELFAALAGSIRPSGGTIELEGVVAEFAHPRDAIDKGIAYVPGDRTDALLPQRSVRENIALPFSAGPRRWGPINKPQERGIVNAAIERLQIDTRAQGEVRRLSGGNQQKVTIARWIAADARTILCFDPTRGIDVRTKTQIYALLRDLAAQGKSILYYTSELEEIQLVCDRAIAIFGGRVVDTLPVEIADEVALTRAAYGLARGARADVGILVETARPEASA